MIDFSTTTAFRLVRQLAAGQGSTAMYLLICEERVQNDIEADLQAEAEVQLGVRLTINLVTELLYEENAFALDDVNAIRVFRIDRWSPELIGLLDTHVVRLEQTGAQLLFLTTDVLSEQLLVAAPNFRNRLTEVLRILPDDTSGGIRN
jgi:hypothetical protein